MLRHRIASVSAKITESVCVHDRPSLPVGAIARPGGKKHLFFSSESLLLTLHATITHSPKPLTNSALSGRDGDLRLLNLCCQDLAHCRLYVFLEQARPWPQWDGREIAAYCIATLLARTLLVSLLVSWSRLCWSEAPGRTSSLAMYW